MNTSLRLAGFVLAIALVFVAAYSIGTAVGPEMEQAPTVHEHGMVNAE
ncbi:MAG: hypothetical protein WBQ44_09295 [Rhodococcus sp. (in: high G+C Gram-positive bacteria)]